MKFHILNKQERVPHQNIYNILLTLILAFAILWIIYISVSYTPYRLYLVK